MERRAASWRSVGGDLAVRLLDDAVAGRQTKPGSLPGFLRCEERIKHLSGRPLVHASARVNH